MCGHQGRADFVAGIGKKGPEAVPFLAKLGLQPSYSAGQIVKALLETVNLSRNSPDIQVGPELVGLMGQAVGFNACNGPAQAQDGLA